MEPQDGGTSNSLLTSTGGVALTRPPAAYQLGLAGKEVGLPCWIPGLAVYVGGGSQSLTLACLGYETVAQATPHWPRLPHVSAAHAVLDPHSRCPFSLGQFPFHPSLSRPALAHPQPTDQGCHCNPCPASLLEPSCPAPPPFSSPETHTGYPQHVIHAVCGTQEPQATRKSKAHVLSGEVRPLS